MSLVHRAAYYATAGAILLLAAATDRAIAAEWAMIPGDSAIRVHASQFGRPFEARFERFTGQITFEPGEAPTGHVRIEVDIASFRSGAPDRDTQAQGGEWFAGARAPHAIFEAERFMHLGDSRYEAMGTLSIKGVSSPLALPFTVTIESDRAEMRGSVSLDRMVFGLGSAVDAETVGRDVSVDVIVRATRTNKKEVRGLAPSRLRG